MVDLAFLLLATLLAALAFSGWGRLALRLAGVPAADVGVAEIWTGLTLVTILVTLLHFAVPIDWRATLALGLGGVLLALLPDRGAAWRRLAAAAAAGIAARPLLAGLAAVSVLGLALHAMAVPDRYDSGLYYFGSIRWLNEYRIVPGLGNLLDRFAHSEAIFRSAALLNAYPFWGKGYALIHFFLQLLAAATVAASGLWRMRGGILLVAGAALAIVRQLVTYAPAASADDAAGLAAIAMLVVLVRIARKPAAEGASREDAFLLAVLALFAVLTKYSTAAFVLAALAVAAPWLFRTARLFPRAALAAAALGIVGMAAQAMRSYVLSGVPFYPAEIGGLWDLPWAMSRRAVALEAAYIASWARLPGHRPEEVLGNWDWLGSWLRSFPAWGWATILGSLLLCAASLAIGLRNARPEDRRFRLLYLPLAVAIAFWFFTAPVIRLLIPPPEASLGFAAFLLVRAVDARRPGLVPGLALAERLPASFALFAAAILLAMPFARPSLGFRPIPVADLSVHTTASGLKIFHPRKGDQCWDAPLPCSGYPRDNMRLLGDGLQTGFTRRPPPTAPAAASP